MADLSQARAKGYSTVLYKMGGASANAGKGSLVGHLCGS